MPKTKQYLALRDVATRIGVTEGTIRGYSREGRLPAPDAITGTGPRAVRGWLAETIDTWNANRPGRGNHKRT